MSTLPASFRPDGAGPNAHIVITMGDATSTVEVTEVPSGLHHRSRGTNASMRSRTSRFTPI